MISILQVRPVELGDRSEWTRLRLALWPDEGEQAHRTAVERFFARPRTLGSMPEVALVAVAPDADPVVVGFTEVSRRAYAEGCETSPVGFLEGWYVVRSAGARASGAPCSRPRAWARKLGCREFASDAVANNAVSAAAHRALGFEEVVVLRCFRKSLPDPPAEASS